MNEDCANYKKLLSKKISLWQKINLTHFEYWVHLRNPYNIRKKHYTDCSMISYATFMSLCSHCRDYIDIFLKRHYSVIKEQTPSIQAMIYSDFGLVLFDLGYKDEGVMCMQKAVDVYSIENDKAYMYVYILCSRLNALKYFNRRFDLAKYGFKSCENKHAFDPILTKSYIDLKLFDKAEKAIDDIEKHYGNSWANVFKAELFFEKKQFNLAAKFYSKNKLPYTLPTWRPQYDYKKALAYYYAGWDKNWRKQAMKIKRRKQWDKYYDIESLNECGIERNKEIDAIINSESDNLVFDFDRMIHYLRMLIKIAYQLIKANWPYLFLIFALLFYIIDKLCS